MGYVGDLSKYQPTSKIDWPTFAKNFELLIFRVQYGSTGPDAEYANHVANAKKYKVPFLTYAFPAFTDAADARVEARDARKREDKDSLAIIIDIESEHDSAGNPIGISKFSNADRLEGIKAYVDELRKQGAKKVGGYIAHNVYKEWGIDSIIGIFDFVWIPRYGQNDGTTNHDKPDFPCDLWQFTSEGKLPGYAGPLDLSIFTGSKNLSWFIGSAAPAPAKPATPAPSKPAAPSKPSPAKTHKVVSGDSLWKIAHDNGITVDSLKSWNHLTSDTIYPGLVLAISGPAAAPAPSKPAAPSHPTYKVVSGDNLSVIAARFGTTVSQLVSLNGLKTTVIQPGQVLRLK